MRVVLDTNVWLSGLLWTGTPHQLLRLVQVGAIAVAVSEPLVAELRRSLSYAKLQARLQRLDETPDRLIAAVQEVAEWYLIASLTVAELRDPDDAVVLATAIAAQADAIVTGDRDLLALTSFAGIPILTPKAFLEQFNRS